MKDLNGLARGRLTSLTCDWCLPAHYCRHWNERKIKQRGILRRRDKATLKTVANTSLSSRELPSVSNFGSSGSAATKTFGRSLRRPGAACQKRLDLLSRCAACTAHKLTSQASKATHLSALPAGDCFWNPLRRSNGPAGVSSYSEPMYKSFDGMVFVQN